MNKFVTVLGVAAVATLAGCKDPNYRPMGSSQNEVKPVPPPVATAEPAEVHCACPKGTKHVTPCACGAQDCTCEVVEVVEPVVETDYTIYIVQKGDYLAKISKKYNIAIDSIKKLNNLKSDKIRLGQKLKLPGKIDVGVQTVPEGAIKTAKPVTKKPFEPYSGETVDYKVQSGDTLGKIAYGNGINIRQLKALNNLKKDNLRIGQVLKVPANGKSVKAAPASAVVAPVTPATVESSPTPESAPLDEVAPVETTEPSADIPASTAEDTTYVVQEGDDLMAISISTGVSLSTLRELNNLPVDAKLTTGQVLKLPAEE